MDNKHEIWGCGCFLYCPLHAAAPALLEALEALVGTYDKGGSYVELNDFIVDARAAIAQAKGENDG